MRHYKTRPSTLACLLMMLLFSSCGGCSQFEAEKRLGPDHVTHLTYQINLPKGADGKYRAKPGQEIVITAEAHGPHADIVKWGTSVEEVEGVPIYIGKDIGRTPSSQFANLVKDPKKWSVETSCQIDVTCVPITSSIKYGKKLLKGTKKFEIVFE